MRLHFSLDKRPFCGLEAGLFPVFRLRWAHLSCQRASPFVDIEHGQHGKSPVSVLGEAAITRLGESPEALECEERVLDLGAHTGLYPVGGFVGLRQRPVFVGTLVGKVFRPRRQFPEPFPLSRAAVPLTVL